MEELDYHVVLFLFLCQVVDKYYLQFDPFPQRQTKAVCWVPSLSLTFTGSDLRLQSTNHFKLPSFLFHSDVSECFQPFSKRTDHLFIEMS